MAKMDAEQRLLDKLAELSAMIDETGDDDHLDADNEAAMIARCQAPGAPLGWQSIYNRVTRGTLTWQQVWSHPRDVGPEGISLVNDVSMASMQSSRESLAASLNLYNETFRDR